MGQKSKTGKPMEMLDIDDEIVANAELNEPFDALLNELQRHPGVEITNQIRSLQRHSAMITLRWTGLYPHPGIIAREKVFLLQVERETVVTEDLSPAEFESTLPPSQDGYLVHKVATRFLQQFGFSLGKRIHEFDGKKCFDYGLILRYPHEPLPIVAWIRSTSGTVAAVG